MSMIQKLSIQGIRSFGTDHQDAQSITFSSPVTLILGENGCGKTTIIESIKYALTGDCPPGSDRGKNFVHDPKVFGLGDALGQIKLLASNSRGDQVSVCRSMKISTRNGKYTFETLDATTNYMKGGASSSSKGGADSFSGRCIDTDVAMCQFMGVSKAIINNVLFCHQEDSSWPLDEGKKLKEKFDAIFGITMYNKAIDGFIQMRKTRQQELKLKEADLRLLEHVKKEMENKTMALQKAQQKCEGIKELCKKCEEEVKPIDERLQEIRAIEMDVGKYQALKLEMETKQKHFHDQIANLQRKIKTPFEGDIKELDTELRNFGQHMLEKAEELKELQEKLNMMKVQEKSLQRSHAEFDKKHCMLKQQFEKQQQCNVQRADKMAALCRQLSITVNTDLREDAAGVASTLEKLRSALSNEQAQQNQAAHQYETEDQQRQADIDTLRVGVTKLEQSVSSMNKQKETYSKEHRSLELKINEIDASSQRLKKVTQSIEKFNKHIDLLKSKFNADEVRASIATRKAKVQRMQDEFHKLDEQLTKLNSVVKVVAEIGLKNKEVEKKELEVRRLRNKHSENFRNIFKQPVDANFKRALQVIYENLRREIKELNEKESALKLKKQSLEIKRKTQKEELSRCEKELEELKEKIFEKCHSTPYEELLTKSKATVGKYQLEHSALLSAEAMYKRYIEKIEADPCCPLCHKGMEETEAIDLKTEISDEILRLPANIKKAGAMLKVEQKKYEALLELKPSIDGVARLETEIPRRKEELKATQEKLATCENESEVLQLLLAEPTSNMDTVNSMMGDMSLLDEALKEVLRLKQELETLKRKTQGQDTNVSIDELQMQKSAVSGELQNERTEVEKAQKNYEECIEMINKVRDDKNKLQEEQVKLQEGVQSLPQLKERKEELSALLDHLNTEIEEAQRRAEADKQKLNAAVTEKRLLKESNRKSLAQKQAKFDGYKNANQEIQRLHKEMLDYEKMELGAEIERLNESITSSKNRLTEKSTEIANTAEVLDAIKTECLNQETLERDLKDNRELKLLQKQQLQLNESSVKLNQQLKSLDFRSVSHEKAELVRKRDEATVRKAELLGQVGEINNQVKNIEKEINEPKYKDSVLNHRRANYEVEICRSIISDLGQYRIALEWALIQFHKEKMEKINRIIREYWRLIYRGNDIDFIQIETQPEKATAEASADRKRTYNYRVVQSKNNSVIDMRGRCSAGQRVLASVIIRMALAETFSSNCGVLALDEPTTNLDRSNIISLCEALNRIIDDRQTNLNLIIITHDEGFISALGKIDTYHRVFRNDEGKSVIRQVKIN